MVAKRRYSKASSRIIKRRKAKKYASMFLKISFPVAILIGLFFLLRADFLQVKNFEISGTKTLQQESVRDVANNFISGMYFSLIPKTNIFLMNKDKLAAVLSANFARLEGIEINKKFFSESVKLSLVERKEDFLWCSPQEECFFMDKSGLIFAPSNRKDLLIFRGIIEENPLLQNFASGENMQNYLRLIDSFKEANLEIISINVEFVDKAVAETKIGDIIFNPRDSDLSLAAQNTILLINEIRNKSPSALFQYIDTRFGNKIFYKLR